MIARAASAFGRKPSSALERMRAVVDAMDAPANMAAWRATLAETKTPHVIAFANARALNLAADDADFALALTQADTLLRDGVGAKILMRRLSRDPGANLNGTDLIPDLLDEAIARGDDIALLGTAQPWLGRAADAIRERGGDVALVIDGFQSIGAYRSAVAGSTARFIILAMGMPKQEAVAIDLKAALDRPCIIICGGAILDFLGGRFPRAPSWMRDMGLEWVYRLLREPVRLFRRYVIGNVVFLWRAARLRSTVEK